MQTAVADAAATAATAAATTAQLSSAFPGQEIGSLLNAQQQATLLHALSNVKLALQRSIATDLLLLIELERAVASSLAVRLYSDRVRCLDALFAWMDLPSERTKQLRALSNRFQRLLWQEADRVYWAERARADRVQLSWEALAKLQACLPVDWKPRQFDIRGRPTVEQSADQHALWDEVIDRRPPVSGTEIQDIVLKRLKLALPASKSSLAVSSFLAAPALSLVAAPSPAPPPSSTAARSLSSPSVDDNSSNCSRRSGETHASSAQREELQCSDAEDSRSSSGSSSSSSSAVSNNLLAAQTITPRGLISRIATQRQPTSKQAAVEKENVEEAVTNSSDDEELKAPDRKRRRLNSTNEKPKKRKRAKRAYVPIIDAVTEIGSATLKAWLANTSDITLPSEDRVARFSLASRNSSGLARDPAFDVPFLQRRLKAARTFMCEGLTPGSSAYTRAWNKATALDFPSSGLGCMGPKIRALMRAHYTSDVRLKHLPYRKPTDQQLAAANDGIAQLASAANMFHDPAQKDALDHDLPAEVEEWPPRVYFAEPLVHLLPFHPHVQQHLRTSGAVIVIPSSADQATFRINPAARDAHTYAETQVALMTLSACSVARLRTQGELDEAKEAAVAAAASSPLYEADLLTPEERDRDIQAFLEKDWAALMKKKTSKKRAQRPIAPTSLRDRRYCKNVSEMECRDEKEGPWDGFFPEHTRALDAILQPKSAEEKKEEKEEDGAVASAKRLTWLEQHFQRLAALQQLQRQERDEKCRAANKPSPAPISFFTHALHMDELQLHRESLSLLSAVRLDGAEGYYLYEKLGFQFFNLHIEQMMFTFIHHQLEGESLWFIIPYSQLDKLYELAADVYAAAHPRASRAHCLVMGRAQLLAKEFFFPRSVLAANKITVREVTLKSGEVLIAHGGYAHFGYSTHPGSTLSVSTNVVTDDWLEEGLPFLLQHFQWIIQLAEEVLPAAAAAAATHAPAAAAELSEEEEILLRLAYEAINLCPCTFVCSFLRGLLAEADVALANLPTLCTYSELHDWSGIRDRCLQVLQLVHGDARDSIQRVIDQYYRYEQQNKPEAVCHACCTAPSALAAPAPAAAVGAVSMELESDP